MLTEGRLMRNYIRPKQPVGFVLLALLAIGCGSITHTPDPPIASPLASASNPPTFAADVNRNIAAAAMLSSGASTDYRLGPEDLLEITLFNIPESLNAERQMTPRTLTVRVSHQGQISLPLLGELDVKGLTASDLERRLREAYDKY